MPTSFTKETKMSTSYTKETQPTTTFHKESKPGDGGYLTTEDNFFILQENGDRIILENQTSDATQYTKETKP